jgi:predicted aspartyl protease
VTVDFVLDTGVTDITVPSKAVEERGTLMWCDANNGLHEAVIVMLRELQIAGHVLRDINVLVTDNDEGLLGQVLLRHFASYKFDNQRDVLVLELLS